MHSDIHVPLNRLISCSLSLVLHPAEVSIVISQGQVAILADAAGLSLLRAALPAGAVSVQLPFAARGISTTPVPAAAAKRENTSQKKRAQDQAEQVRRGNREGVLFYWSCFAVTFYFRNRIPFFTK